MFRAVEPSALPALMVFLLGFSPIAFGELNTQRETEAGSFVVAEKLRDPTQPLTKSRQRVSGGKLQLHSILISETRRIAIINGQRVSENDNIRGVKVLRILPDEVIIQQNGKSKSLKLGTSIKKQRPG